MANSRPSSMIIPPGVFDETNTNGSKILLPKKDLQSVRILNQGNLPTNNNLINAHSSSSSIDSTGARNAMLNEKNSFTQINSTTTISSTTTDSDLESEQDERYTDDNNLSESNNLPFEIKNDKLSRQDSVIQKTDDQNQEQVSRRVKHFRKLFKSEIVNDMPDLIDSYVCAYQGDILLQGKMYITDRYLCFHSRIISYVTKHVYRWEDIENVTKERVAFIFPTAIGIQLKSTGKKIIYASFLQRDQAYDKILLICSRFNHDLTTFQDDEDNGTLKPLNHNRILNDKTKKSKRDLTYEMPDDNENDEVLQMCLTQEKSTNDKRSLPVLSAKTSDEKGQNKKSNNSFKKKLTRKTSANEQQTLSNETNENNLENNQAIRNSRFNQNQQQQNNTTLKTISSTYIQSHNINQRIEHSRTRDRTSSPTNRSLSTITTNSNSSSNLTKTLQPILTTTDNDSLIKRYIRIILLSIVSIIKLFIEYILLLYNQFKTYPIKTSLILLIFVMILTVHSFYLIKLAYRIENRLQSLHHKWPSPSSMKSSLPTIKEL